MTRRPRRVQPKLSGKIQERQNQAVEAIAIEIRMCKVYIINLLKLKVAREGFEPSGAFSSAEQLHMW